ncbi:unnamed protein product [Linum tenue]|uniref:Uncharacterized protein n=1 Tax=Linum tenue TaxID=586396 RepID=A0AAV0IZX4_9ROSI|nr:unnamed protein product [Linum tenue]
MEDPALLLISDGSPVNVFRENNKLDEDEEDFRSCCGDDEVWKVEEPKADLDEFSVKMFFKGVSITDSGHSGPGYSGIGVVMERQEKAPLVQVQKKLDFYVESSVADYLALMDGLTEAVQNNFRHVYASTDSSLLYNQSIILLFTQITHKEKIENPLLIALRERIVELTGSLETFLLKLVPSCALERPLHLAQIAVGIVSFPGSGDKKTHGNCSFCFEDKMLPMMITLKCSHKFCSHCMTKFVEAKMQESSSQVPIRCPQLGCKYYLSISECRSFLPHASYESFMEALAEVDDALHSDRIYCPYSDCSVLLDPRECLSARASSSSQSDNSLCGHEFCYSCGAEYRDRQQTCHCAFWNEEDNNSDDLITQSVQESEQWAWETFNSLPMLMDAYSDQERSQLALIQRFLSGGFSLSDHHPTSQSPPRCTDSYVDTMKDLHRLPWLERFVSVISDNYYEDFLQ